MTISKRRWTDILAVITIVALLLGGLVVPATANNMRIPTSPAGGSGSLNEAVRLSTTKNSYSFDNAILGIDVSKWNGTINWTQVARDNPVSFAFVRSNYGVDLDPLFVTNATGAHENGLYVGAYHYARFKNRAEMQQEAASFISQLKKVTITYPVALDLEHTSHGLSKSELTALSKEFMDLVAAQGYTVMLYTYSNYIGKYLDSSNLGGYNLWVANYLEQPTVGHKIWQYTNTGRIQGTSGHVDINVAYESMATGGGRQVSRDVSTSIRQLINERYGSSLSLEALDIEAVNHEIACALQTEINTQLGHGIAVDGVLTANAIEGLNSINFVLNQTNGRITCLMQSKLFYKGYYTESITGVYDDHTYQALQRFQMDHGLEVTGNMNYDTWAALMDVVNV